MTLVQLTLAVTAASIALLQAQPAKSQGLPEGEGKEIIERSCTSCHDIALVTAERHSEQQWKDLVDDMVRRGAEATDSERKVILTYLVKNFGK
jgi:cytochrome c5